MAEKVTSELILDTLRTLIESKKVIAKEEWLNIAFKLNILNWDEKKMLNRMSQAVAKLKLEIYKKQEKKNVAAAELEIDASEEELVKRDQQAKIDAIEEFVMIAKKQNDY